MNKALTAIGHAFVSVILFAIPLALSTHSGWQDLTLSGILNAIYLHFTVLKK